MVFMLSTFRVERIDNCVRYVMELRCSRASSGRSIA